jgi:hypothetical protein
MDENLKVIPRTFTPRQIWVDGKPELPPHIDAGDFDDKWQARAAMGQGFVSMKFEFKQVGRIKTTVMEEDRVELCWSTDDGRRLNRQSITLSRFKAEGQDHVYLGCPGCGRPRKQLFLVAVRNKGRPDDGTKAFAFICKKCSGIDTGHGRNWRRRPGTRERCTLGSHGYHHDSGRITDSGMRLGAGGSNIGAETIVNPKHRGGLRAVTKCRSSN